MLAEQGQWARCIEKAKAHNTPILHKYVALYAAKLLKDGFIQDALNLYATYGAPAMPQNFNIYNHIASELFASPDLVGSDAYAIWDKLRQVLFEIVTSFRNFYIYLHELIIVRFQNEGLDKVGSNVNVETKNHFKNLLLITHYYGLRAVCRQVPSLKLIAVKISTALLRYTDIIPADKAFYEAGMYLS